MRKNMKTMWRTVLVMGFFSMSPSLAYPGDLAVVVSQENLTNEVSFQDLVKIFRQERQYWDGGKRIYLIMPETGNPEKEVVLRKIYKMEDQELKKFWVGKLFRQEISSFPKTLRSSESIKRFVNQVPNAVGVIDQASVDNRVKVLRIDGKLPGQAGYALSENP